MKSSKPPSLSGRSPKPYFFSGYRNRPVVYGGILSNRQSISRGLTRPPSNRKPFELRKWNPESRILSTRDSSSPSPKDCASSERLSSIARFIFDTFRKNGDRWGPSVASELNKLRRITPNMVSEVLKIEKDARIAAKFFHWAGKQKGYRHDFAAYNAFAYCLNRTGHFRAADQLPELMESQGRIPSEKQFEILIRMHSDKKRGLRVYYVYQKMKKFGVKPRVFLYNRIIDALMKTDNFDLAMTVYEDFKQDGLVEESITFMILIKGLCKAGKMEKMFEILQRMREKLCKPDAFAYMAMIKMLVSEGYTDAGLRVWDEMKCDRIEPDVMAYGILIMGLCKEGRVERGYELFKEMKRKKLLIDRETYKTLIEGFVADGKVRSARDLWKDLADSGYIADLGIYNALIKGLCNEKQVDKAYKLFQVAIKEELEPDFETLNPIMLAYVVMKRLDEFCSLLDQIVEYGYQLEDYLSQFFRFLCAEEERIILSLDVFDVLKSKGQGSVSVYNILMDALYKIGEIHKSLSLLSEMQEYGIKPDSSSYSVAICCFVEKGEIKEAFSCHNKVIDMSCVPSVPAYVSLAKGLCQTGEIDAAMVLVRECLGKVESGPMEFKYALRVIHACKENNTEKVMEVLDEMKMEGLSSCKVIYCAIIFGMSKHGTLKAAREVFTEIKEGKDLTEDDMAVYDEMLTEHMNKKTKSPGSKLKT